MVYTEVTKQEFFAFVMGARFDIHPKHHDPNVTYWEKRDRTVVGKTLPGWKNPGDQRQYFLASNG